MDREIIYQYDKKIDRIIERFKNSRRVSNKNFKLLCKFKDQLFAENLSGAIILFYLNRLMKIVFLLKKDLDNATKDDLKQVIAIVNNKPLNNGHTYSAETKKDFAVSISRFYRWLYRDILELWDGERDTKPDILKGGWLKTGVKVRDTIKVKKRELITHTEIKELVQAATNRRNKALITTMFESGCRCGEMISMKISSIDWGTPTTIEIDGKTGVREPCIGQESTRLLKKWLKVHPRANDPNAYIWCTSTGFPMKPDAIIRMIKRTAKRANINRRIYPHLFRHSRATELAKSMNQQLLCKQFGWKSNSKMPGIYVHLDQSDLKHAYSEAIGEKPKKVDTSTITYCPNCERDNNHYTSVCACGQDLDPVSMQLTALEKQEEEKLKQMLWEQFKDLKNSINGKKYLEVFIK